VVSKENNARNITSRLCRANKLYSQWKATLREAGEALLDALLADTKLINPDV
jgi:hypothetical protein